MIQFDLAYAWSNKDLIDDYIQQISGFLLHK